MNETWKILLRETIFAGGNSFLQKNLARPTRNPPTRYGGPANRTWRNVQDDATDPVNPIDLNEPTDRPTKAVYLLNRPVRPEQLIRAGPTTPNQPNQPSRPTRLNQKSPDTVKPTRPNQLNRPDWPNLFGLAKLKELPRASPGD